MRKQTVPATTFDSNEIALLRAYLQTHGSPSTWVDFSGRFIKDARAKFFGIERLASMCTKLMALPDDELWHMMRGLAPEASRFRPRSPRYKAA